MGKSKGKRTTGTILAALAAVCLETADKSRYPCLNLLKKRQLGPSRCPFGGNYQQDAFSLA
ncbi:MAG: hypothetical protein GX044_07520 [Firmicutes bacterium]|jgi:hypothetical protein|nr:hypothetical protein [Bacillota bacterium]